MTQQITISPAPHVKDKDSIRSIMAAVILALLPAGIFSVYIFGMHALFVILTASIAAVATEWVCQIVMKRPVTIGDGSALLTGMLVAYNVPAEVPLWLPAAGSVFGILIGKQIFGGLGYNPMNPALLGRAFLMASWPVHMTVFKTIPRGSTLSGIDAVTTATPLNVFKHAREILIHSSNYSADQVSDAAVAVSGLYSSLDRLFYGNVGGCIGETSALFLLIGAAYLMYRHIVGWKIPASYILTVGILSWIFGGTSGLGTGNPFFHILSGGVILGAFFMATDMVTTPVTFFGRILFGVGCGVITVVIRLWGGYPEGVSYSILLMNLVTPILDRTTVPKKFGGA